MPTKTSIKISTKYKESVKNYTKKKEQRIMTSRNKKMFHNYIKQKLHDRTGLPPLLNQNGETIVKPKDKADLLNTHFSKVFVDNKDKNIPILSPFPHFFKTMPNFEIILPDVLTAIQGLKSSVSNSPDQIPSLYLKKTKLSIARPLVILFNMSLKCGKIPEVWRKTIVTPIFKNGQTNSPSNYRPISLTSGVCRLIESIVHKYLCSFLNENSLLSSFQHGFLSKRSTLSQQLCFFNNLTTMYKHKDTCEAVYIDFSKAFDRISHHKLLHVLKHYKINQTTLYWISDFLTNRFQHTLVDGELSKKCSVVSGVPQGSVLGPLLFVLYLDSLMKSLSDNNVTTTVYAYADDLKILSNNKQDLQNTLNVIQKWAKDWDFLIQPVKSEHIFFSTKPISSDSQFFINEKPIPHCNTVKDLGITLSSNFKWSAHISKLASKANYLSFNILRSFKSLEPSLYINLYKSHIRPLLEYNTPIWYPTLRTDVRTVEKVQRKFTRRLCQKINISFTSYLHRLEILRLETLESRRIKIDLTILYKILHNLIDVDFKDFFCLSSSKVAYNLRGHSLKLQDPGYSGSPIRENFFSHRIIQYWNKLPDTVVNSPNLQTFKLRLKQFDIYKIYTSKL